MMVYAKKSRELVFGAGYDIDNTKCVIVKLRDDMIQLGSVASIKPIHTPRIICTEEILAIIPNAERFEFYAIRILLLLLCINICPLSSIPDAYVIEYNKKIRSKVQLVVQFCSSLKTIASFSFNDACNNNDGIRSTLSNLNSISSNVSNINSIEYELRCFVRLVVPSIPTHTIYRYLECGRGQEL